MERSSSIPAAYLVWWSRVYGEGTTEEDINAGLGIPPPAVFWGHVSTPSFYRPSLNSSL